MGSAATQAQLWGGAVRDWAEIQEGRCSALWEVALDAARVGKGTRFLDAGCGAGGASVLAARRGAQVHGIDATGALVMIARDRVVVGDFRVGDLEELPFESASFDAVLACNSLQFAADPVAALREMRRVLAPAGRIAVATWAAKEQCENGAIFDAVSRALPTPPPGEGPFALSAPGQLESLLAQAGLTPVERGEVDCPFTYANAELFWRGQSSSGPFQAAIRAVGEAKVRSAVLEAATPYVTETGAVVIRNRFVYIAAE
jgi:SAM-dependent methyltransferase